MKTVFKVETTIVPFPMPVRIPHAATILHIGQQYPHSTGTDVSIWFEIEAGTKIAPDDVRFIAAFATGVYIPDNAIYLSTHILDAGRQVFHLYEMVSPEEMS